MVTSMERLLASAEGQTLPRFRFERAMLRQLVAMKPTCRSKSPLCSISIAKQAYKRLNAT